MVVANNYQTIINTAITTYGSSITITPLTVTLNTRGDETESAGTPVSTVAVPFDYFSFMGQMVPFNKELDVGETKLIIKAAETIDKNDKVTFNSQDYRVTSIQPFEIQDVVLAKQITLMLRS